MNVLIAEDETSIARVYQIMLESYAHNVTLTGNGQECVEAYKQVLAQHSSFDVVLMDGRMPIMDGIQAAKIILELNKDQRIVFVSAFMKTTMRDSMKDLPRVLEVISKPVELDYLVHIVENPPSVIQRRY